MVLPGEACGGMGRIFSGPYCTELSYAYLVLLGVVLAMLGAENETMRDYRVERKDLGLENRPRST